MLYRIAPLLVFLVGCDSGQPFDVNDFTGTYVGTEFIVEPDGDEEEIEVTIRFEANEQAGTITMRGVNTFGGTPPIEGTYDENGARFSQQFSSYSFMFEIDPDGDIRGDGEFSVFGESGTIEFSGRLTPDRLEFNRRTLTLESQRPERVGARGSAEIHATRAE